MSNWSSGYVSDIDYTYGYYRELNPLRIKLAFLNAGIVFPECGVACELGFGQGVSANIHAAASTTKWYGTDFLPSQAGFAQELAKISGANAQLFDESFSEFTSREDLPEFDYIAMHGIWTWISEENRALIIDFIRRKLKVGGVLYISYNTYPGWSNFAPMRQLIAEHALINGCDGESVEKKIDKALEFAQEMLTTNPTFLRANPLITERMKSVQNQNRQYLAHEYFNKDWAPMHFSKVKELLEPTKLTFACSAHYLDQIDSLNLTEEQQKFLREIGDASFRESVRDYMVNQQFRREFWVKGRRELSMLEKFELMKQQKFVMTTPRKDITLKVTGNLGEGEMSSGLYNPVLDFLSDYKVRSFEEIFNKVSNAEIDYSKLVQIITVLAGIGHIAPTQDPAVFAKEKTKTDKLNMHLMSMARISDKVAFLASPVLGAGVSVPRFNQIFLFGIRKGLKEPKEWAKLAWTILNSQNQKIVKDGKTMESEQENLEELLSRANEFSLNQLPILKALMVI